MTFVQAFCERTRVVVHSLDDRETSKGGDMMAFNELPVRFRNSAGTMEMVIDSDRHPEGSSPLEDDELFEVVGLNRRSRLMGHRQMDAISMAAAIEMARARGDLTFTVYFYEHTLVRYSLTPFNDPWDSGRAGVVIVSRPEMEKVDFTAETVTEYIEGLLESYSDWCNGKVFGYAVWQTRQCRLGDFHRVDTLPNEAVGGYIGDDGMKAMLVDSGLVTDEDSVALASEWVAVEAVAHR